MKKIVILILYVLFGANLLVATTNKESNFTVVESCLVDLQKKRDSFLDNYYTSLVFSSNLKDARNSSKNQMVKKINLQISATSTLYYKNESTSVNNIYIKEITQQEFRQDIESASLNLNIDALSKKEFYCHSKGELFFLSMVKKSDVYTQAKDKLNELSKANMQAYKQILNTKNFLKKVFLFEQMRMNYLPYLMILKSSKKYNNIQNKYVNELLFYQKKYKIFLKNVEVYITIKAPKNRVYTIGHRVDEARQELIKYLSKYSIYATSINNTKDLKRILRKAKKDCIVINIILKDVQDKKTDEKSSTGSAFIDYLRLEFRLYNINKYKKWEQTGAYYINYPQYVPQYYIKPAVGMQIYNKKNNILKRLSGIPKNAVSLNGIDNTRMIRDNKYGIVVDTSTDLQWQDNEISVEMNWNSAKQYCKKLSLNGKGWRLPNKKELHTILDKSQKEYPSISKVFLNTAEYYYWTSTPGAGDGLWYRDERGYLEPWFKSLYSGIEDEFYVAWYIYFAHGYQYFDNINNKYNVRCVR